MADQEIQTAPVVASATFLDNQNNIVTVRLIPHDPSSSINPAVEMASNDPIHLKAYGDIFPIVNIERYERKLETTNMPYLFEEDSSKLVWSREFSTDSFGDMRIAGIGLAREHGRDVAIFCGTTAGRGKAFGGAFTSGSHADIDGFITKIDADDGKVLRSVRLHTLPGYTDEIRGMCIDHDENALYIVGSTTKYDMTPIEVGNDEVLVYTAFINKIDLETFDTLWSREVREISKKNHVYGRRCSIETNISGKGNVYFSGIVKDGGQVNQNIESFGEDDVFITYFDTNGSYIFLRQFGSERDDHIITMESDWIHQDGVSIGGAVLSTGSYHIDTSSNFDSVDFVFQVTPKNNIHVLFGDLPSGTKAVMMSQNANPPPAELKVAGIERIKAISLGGFVVAISCLVVVAELIRYCRKRKKVEKFTKVPETENEEKDMILVDDELKEEREPKSKSVRSLV
mmetsp:Transcript_50268/g.58672  ORF Transcript_50268/g.58672 Transcript_50268/m.58672 type:complete len:456 (+) Transcript_50268:39-1406(+)|eukprot:CAMPEP_0194417954 /NCGR_PEP_ID=MMETSP0176-20130528/17024_1 /TAXON_ID=216777 /ORGANISM="Proboscia alata, Strain PI-D3" /LENGTH=455 /DNA_ID=CAMNT_0039224097 /DNA_START=28 /DNA_END=1395 /DNA_ORIENTATION=+